MGRVMDRILKWWERGEGGSGARHCAAVKEKRGGGRAGWGPGRLCRGSAAGVRCVREGEVSSVCSGTAPGAGGRRLLPSARVVLLRRGTAAGKASHSPGPSHYYCRARRAPPSPVQCTV